MRAADDAEKQPSFALYAIVVSAVTAVFYAISPKLYSYVAGIVLGPRISDGVNLKGSFPERLVVWLSRWAKYLVSLNVGPWALMD